MLKEKKMANSGIYKHIKTVHHYVSQQETEQFILGADERGTALEQRIIEFLKQRGPLHLRTKDDEFEVFSYGFE